MEKTGFEAIKNVPLDMIRKTKIDRFIKTAICSVIPSQYVKFCQELKEGSEREKDAAIMETIGDFTIKASQGKLPIEVRDLDPVWRQIKSKETGLKFEDVFDPHKAALLEKITPPVEKHAMQ